MEPWEIHPSLVHFPIALLTAGLCTDLYARARRSLGAGHIATGLYVAGVLTGLVTGLAGLLAFYTVPSAHTEQAHDQVVWHLGLALASVVLFAGVAWIRWRGRRELPSVGSLVVGVVAIGLLTAAGYLGGHIVYHGAMGVQPDLLSPRLTQHHHGGADEGQPASGGDHHGH
ncbi:MAG TPA: DUF2231 domain-containing protein [Isosphaeraceae bacterium]|jgi:uncharacterized membrane protein|nr:DUF2231 domain-containing protein [Isosphaeraceae bacterium]